MILLLLLAPAAWHVDPIVSRRSALVLGSNAAAFAAVQPAVAAKLKDLSAEEQEALDVNNRDASKARSTPSGVRIIDVLKNEDSYAPKIGDHVYAHYKVWNSKGWRSGVTADSSYIAGRPIDWTLGTPSADVLKGIDELIAILDEQITKTQGMMFSAYKAPFEERIDAWNTKLQIFSDLLILYISQPPSFQMGRFFPLVAFY